MKFYVAPMLDYTNMHYRTLLRYITRNSTLFTEMVVCNTIIYGGGVALEADFKFETPLILQLGGSNPKEMELASGIAKSRGFEQFNINVGCPSARVAGAGAFGAVLMRSPELVADLCSAIGRATNIAPSVKCRIGVDELDTYQYLSNFINTVSTKGNVSHFIIHARKAMLGCGFSPHDNRTIPPLNYPFVYQLVKDFPHLQFTLNGGVVTFEDMAIHEAHGVDGVMVGRGVVQDPYMYRHVDKLLYGDKRDSMTRRQLLEAYSYYAENMESRYGSKIRTFIFKSIHNLFYGEHNGKVYRRLIDMYSRPTGQYGNVCIRDAIMKCMEVMSDEVLDRP